MISRSIQVRHLVGGLLALVMAGGVLAAGADLGQTAKQATNWVAIGMFGVFVAITLGITKWAAAQTRSAADFYTAGGGITGFQNGLAIAGDYMSAATLLGLTAMMYMQGVDAYIYMLSFFVGWPIILFLMAERLRNLGKYTFADVASFRLARTPVRTMAAINTLVVDRGAAHRLHLAEQVTWARSAVQPWLDTVAARVTAVRPDLPSDLVALRRLYALVQREALVLAYNDVLVAMALLFIVTAPFAIMVARPRPAGPSGGH